ncbi:MAG: hypothetical protein KF686_03525 [Ramlibacter sp.]|nr:hypothetical protein [Ramlibacter sp.]
MPNKTDPGNCEVAFARSSIGGKKSSWAGGRVSDELKLDLARRCHELGVTESQYVERLLALSLYGFDHVVNVERDLTKKVAGLWSQGARP